MIAKIFKGENLHEGALQSLLVSSPIARSLPPHSLKMALQGLPSQKISIVVRPFLQWDVGNWPTWLMRFKKESARKLLGKIFSWKKKLSKSETHRDNSLTTHVPLHWVIIKSAVALLLSWRDTSLLYQGWQVGEMEKSLILEDMLSPWTKLSTAFIQTSYYVKLVM